MPAVLKKGTKPSTKEPEIANIFAVEEFPDVEDSGPVHDVNKTKDEVAAILKESEQQNETHGRRNKKKRTNDQTPEKTQKKTPVKTNVPSVSTEAAEEAEDMEIAPKHTKVPISCSSCRSALAHWMFD
jgi:hypothetical protein